MQVNICHDAHPGQQSTVSYKQFQAVWAAKGWRLVGEPAAAPAPSAPAPEAEDKGVKP